MIVDVCCNGQPHPPWGEINDECGRCMACGMGHDMRWVSLF